LLKSTKGLTFLSKIFKKKCRHRKKASFFTFERVKNSRKKELAPYVKNKVEKKFFFTR